MDNNYQAPESELVQRGTSENGGSLESALAGEYSLSLKKILSESWEQTDGVKRYILGAGVIMYAALFAVVRLMGSVLGYNPESVPGLLIGQAVTQVLVMAVTMPFAAGILVIAFKKIQGQNFEFGDAFSGFGKTGQLVVTGILMNIMIMIGFALLIIPGIYLSYAYMMAIPLVIDRNMSPWEALETSRKAITKHWFQFFIFWLVMTLILILSALPAFIGLIWTLPMTVLAYALVYRDIFGIESI